MSTKRKSVEKSWYDLLVLLSDKQQPHEVRWCALSRQAQVQRRESLLSRVNTAQTTTHTDVVQRNKERQAQAAKTRAAQEQV
jgi:hypothetical protein